METTLFVTKEYLEKQFKSFNNTLVKPNDKKIKEWLTTLNGNVDVEGSIANTIAKKIASVISGAPEEYDTLKEIADWISSHSSNAEEMLAKIEANKEGILSENEKIELVEGIINTLNGSIDEEGSIAKMLKDAITTSVDNIIICESEDEDIDFSKADWLKNDNVEPEPVLFTADMITDKNITSFVVPEGVTEIDKNAFYGCNNLKSVTIPNTVTTIGSQAFYNCSALESIDIPEGVTEIGDLAFYGCTNLESVTIPNTVTTIRNLALYNCKSLTSIVIPDSVTEIGNNALDWSIVTFAEGSPFKKENGIIYNTETGELSVCYDKTITSVEIPECVTEIRQSAFYGCKNLASVTLPSTLTKIGNYAFFECTSLTSIEIPEGVTEIDGYEFSDWSNVTFAEGSLFKKENGIIWNTETGLLLMCYDKNITSIVIPEGVTEIRNNVFQYCKNLASVTLPSTLTKIGEYAFSNCSSLTSITIPEGVTETGDRAFLNCFNLTSVTLPSTLKKIGDQAFQGCESLTSIEIPEGVTEIGDNAFGVCSKLASVTLPSTLTKIGNSAFGTPSLTSIEIPEGVTEIGDAAFCRCTNLASVTLPSTLKKIGFKAFYYCSSLSTINFTGSEDQWNTITKGDSWNLDTPSNMQIVYNYHG